MFLHFLKNPRQIGALCSSSGRLAQAMIKEINFEQARNIAEIGPGTGVFTKEILKKKTEESRFFALEVDAVLVDKLRKKFPELEIHHRGAEDMLKVLQEEGIATLDVIVSGLPWSIFSQKQQDFLLDQIVDSLSEGGHFCTFAYVLPTPKAKQFRKKLFSRFKTMKISRIVWKNFPPACVYYCQKA